MFVRATVTNIMNKRLFVQKTQTKNSRNNREENQQLHT